jgi:hypothetical protein
MNKTKRRFPKVALILIGFLSWITVMVLLLWLTLPQWLPMVASRIAKPYAAKIDFRVEEIGMKHAFVQDITVEYDQMQLRIPDLSITYKPRRLLSGNLDSIMLLRPALDLKFPVQSSSPQTETQSEPQNLKNLFATPLPNIPFDEFLIESFSLDLLPPSGNELSSILDLRASRSGQQWEVRANLKLDDNLVRFSGYQSSGDNEIRGLEVSFDIPDPFGLLQKTSPFLPEAIETQIKNLSLETGDFYGTLDWKNTDGLINLQTVLGNLKYADILSIDTIFLQADSSDYLNTVSTIISANRLDLPGIGSAKLDGDIDLSGWMKNDVEIEADMNLSAIEISTGEQTGSIDPVKIHAHFAQNRLELDIPRLASAILPVVFEETHVETEPGETVTTVSLEIRINVTDKLLVIEPLTTEAIQLKSHLRLNPNEDPIQGVQSESELIIPDSMVSFDISPEMKLKTRARGQLAVNQDTEEADIAGSMEFEGFDYRNGEELNVTGGMKIDFGVHIPDILPTPEFDPFQGLKNLTLNGKTDFNGIWQKTAFSARALEFHVAEGVGGAVNMFPGTMDVESFKWDVWELQNSHIELKLFKDTAEVNLFGHLMNPSISVKIDYKTTFASPTQLGIVEVFTSPESGRSSVNLQRIDPTLPKTVAEGIVHTSIQIAGTYEKPELALALTLEGGSISMPDSNLTVSGIQLPQLIIENLLSGNGPAAQELSIDTVSFPPNKLSDLHMIFQPLKDFALDIKKLTFVFCGGTFELNFARPLEAPYTSFAFDVHFTGLDLSKLAKLFPDFKDEVEGKIEGSIPVFFKDGKISWKEGYARLMEGTTAKLRYSKTGIIATYMPKIAISKKMDIDINEALQDISLTQVEIKLQSSEQFSSPTVVFMSGHSNNPKIVIPIERIQLNIRAGDVPSILNESIQKSKIFNWIIIKGK